MLGCDDCKYVYCKKCITRNLGRGKFAEINDSDKWSVMIMMIVMIMMMVVVLQVLLLL